MNNYTVVLVGRWDSHTEYVSAVGVSEAARIAQSKAGSGFVVVFITIGHHMNLANYT